MISDNEDTGTIMKDVRKMNFTEHIVELLPAYLGGNDRKETVVLDDGEIWFLKIQNLKDKVPTYQFCLYNAFSEYLGCKIFNLLGFETQEVVLGEYEVISSKGRKKTYVACACKNLERDGFRLSGASVVGYGNSRNPGCTKNPSFDTLSIISDYAYGISEQEIRKFYAEQFVVDAFLGNTDRNNRSWGFLSKSGKPPRIAPVYGCSSCLCPSVREDELSEQRAVIEALNGISVISNQDGNKIPYKQFLFSCKNEDVDLALLKIVPRIEISEIFEMIANTPYVSMRRKEFYCNYLLATYKRVLVPAFEKVNKNS